jgi:hypothetical protein
VTPELQNSNFSPPHWLFNPAITGGKNRAFNPHSIKSHQTPQSEPITTAFLPRKKIPRSDLPAPLPAAPEHLVASASEMASKKSEIEEMKKDAEPLTTGWTHSKCSLNNLNKLVSEGLLQEKNLVNWRPSFREPFPMENVDEIITFLHFAERGLALPTCSFFRGLLYYYGLELHHLNPNSICHISIFIHFCEAFLGIELHWDLFCFLFRVKPQPTTKKLAVVGGAGIKLCQQAGEKYLSYKFPSNLPGWKNQWFYIENHAPQLPTKSNRPLVVRGEWNLEPSGMEMIQVKELLEAIEAQKKKGVTGASIMFSFYKRCVQPIQQRCCLGFEYTGPAGPSRMRTEEVPDEVALQRVQRVLLDVDAVPYVPTLFSARNPPKPVSIRLLSLKKSATLPVLN